MTQLPVSVALFIISVLAFVAGAENERSPKWEISTGLKQPESVCYDAAAHTIYISNAQGWITRATSKGVVTDARWIEGLRSPRGMAVSGSNLWVVDGTDLVQVDTASTRVVQRQHIGSAIHLSDVAVAPSGAVYVSDPLGSRIFECRGQKCSVLVMGGEWDSPKGLLFSDDKLVVASWGLTVSFNAPTRGGLYSIDLASKQRIPITNEPVGNLDGPIAEKSGTFLVSDRNAGLIYRISVDGKPTAVLQGLGSAADMDWIADTRLLLVPRRNENKLSAYALDLDNV